MDECQQQLDFEELEKLCRYTPEDLLTDEEDVDGGDEVPVGGEAGGGTDAGGGTELDGDGRGRAMGQSESKKSSKKATADGGPQTKGTAMSFGFKKYKAHRQATGGSVDGERGVATSPDAPVPGAVANQIKKLNANGNGPLANATLEREKAERDLVQATVISNPGVDAGFSDKNGNTGLADAEDRSSSTGRSTPRLQPAKKDSHGAPYRSNRFGFRTNNIVRPASVGLQPRVANDLDKNSNNNNNNNNNVHPNNNNNNNNVYVVADKRRSKSASSAASARTTFAPLAAAATGSATPGSGPGGDGHPLALHQHAYGGGALQRPQPKYQTPNTKIAHSTPPPATDTASNGPGDTYQPSVAKGEHKNTASGGGGQPTVATPAAQHQYAPASEAGQSSPVAGTLPGKPPAGAVAKLGQEALVASKFTLHSSSLPKPQYPVSISLTGSVPPMGAPSPRYTMDTKGAKHAVNVSRKEFATAPVALEDTTTATTSSIRMPRQRYRNLAMVMSGRHKFEVRDLEALTTEPIVPLPLPELPSAFGNTANQRTASLSGLIRSSELTASGLGADGTLDIDDIDINDNRYESNVGEVDQDQDGSMAVARDLEAVVRKECLSDGESLEEEKLRRDNNSSEKSLKGALIMDDAKLAGPGHSRVSWCDAGVALALDEKREESRAPEKDVRPQREQEEEEDVSSVTITAGHSSFSSFSAPVPMDVSTNLDSVSEVLISFTDPGTDPLASSEAADLPNRMYRNEQAKFAAMAAAISDVVLLDDETSPTDSLVSSCCTDNSDDAKKPRATKKESARDKEKDIDEISPELDELTSPVSPGTPTHASNSLSLSDGGRDFLIDDEIADQPGLVFDEGSTLDLGSLNLNLAPDTPMSKHSNKRPATGTADQSVTPKATPPVPKPRKVLAETYESPALSRKSTRSNRLARAESLDTLSPCDSIASDDFMLDFDCNSSMDSIDRVARSSVGGSATGLHSLDGLQLWSELENKGGHIIREWSTLLRSSNPNSLTNSMNNNNNQSGHNTSRESITSQLPARARLLTRRLQNNATPTNGSESPRSMDSLPRRTTFSGAYKTATLSQFHNLANNNNGQLLTDSASTATNSAEDLTLLDKSLRNSMLQDVVHFKKQLVRLRRILQEDEENLMMTDTLNPFENNNGQFFTTAAAAAVAASNNSSLSSATGQEPDSNRQQLQENVLVRESSVAALALLEDQRQELADLRRQVVYLQGELTTKDRTIRQQQNVIEKLEADREKQQHDGSVTSGGGSPATSDVTGCVADTSGGDINHAETISTATQTERLRPVSFGGQEGLGSRNEQHLATPKNGLRTPVGASNNSPSTPQQHPANGAPTTSQQHPVPRSAPNKTQISSVYTQLSSTVRHSIAGGSAPTTPTAAGGHPTALRRTSLGSSHNLSSAALGSIPATGSKSVRTTHIGTLAVTGRQHTTGDRIPVSRLQKLLPSPSRTPGTVAPATPPPVIHKRTPSIIKPPSSFGTALLSPATDGQAAVGKAKSAPVTPVISSGKLLTAPATGGSGGSGSVLSSSDAGFSSGSGENESSGKDTSDEGESPPIVHGKLLSGLKLLPAAAGGSPTVASGCGDGASSPIGGPTSKVNGIVGH
ncbi:uncharacterized protein LOC128268451 [Anopheles cruzii]|uniref:uncharacterized protein LOC128268451 n=1 Tax=Anopheles cruzii TaxID=68878 RepID=UPI0022EC7C62|nr:uncharacterized protein LOC128268451 [Anopheles cruzii]